MLAGGDLIAKKIAIRFNDDKIYNAKINFDSSTESKFEITQAGLVTLQKGLAGGLFQIDGVDQTDPSAFKIIETSGGGGLRSLG